MCGVVLQYPNTDGVVEDYTRLIEEAHKNGVSGVWAVWLCVCVWGGMCGWMPSVVVSHTLRVTCTMQS